MIIFRPPLVIVGIGFFCWLLFNLAVFALPFFAGLTIGIWAFHTGACSMASRWVSWPVASPLVLVSLRSPLCRGCGFGS